MKKKIVVLTGAGISAESGIRTFRDSDGLWEGHDVTAVASPEGWKSNPRLVLEFYNLRRRAVKNALPNAAHYGLAALEDRFNVQVITQNIDDLHERAGSTKVMHLHGEIFKMRSERSLHPEFDITGDIHIGDTAPDGAQLRPAIVWFGEAVPMIEPAMALCAAADLFIVIGTSLVVYPAAGLIDLVPPQSPKYIIDRFFPAMRPLPRLFTLEMPATKGVEALSRLLREENSS